MARWRTVSIYTTMLFTCVSCVSAEKIGDVVKAARKEANERRQYTIENTLRDHDSTDDDNMWPFGEYSTCQGALTRDQDNPKEIRKATKPPVKNTDKCGINMFMQSDLASETTRKKRSGRKSFHFKNFMRKLQIQRNMKRRQKQTMPEDEIKDIDDRIIGGSESEEGKFPWVVSIGKTYEGLMCGGSLINERWIITAAHCFEEREELCNVNIRIGSFNWITDQSGYHVDVKPTLIVRHKNFNIETMENDIAMIKLSEPVTLSPDSYMNSICLPDEPTAVGTKTVAAGWGVIHEDDSTIPDTLHEVSLSVLEYGKCMFEISGQQLCAGTLSCCHDTCQGDSGGPLMTKLNGRWYLIGVTSYGYGCGRVKYPGIYTDVYTQKDFISSVLNRY